MKKKIEFCIHKIGVELYYPYLVLNNVNYGICADTRIMYYSRSKWCRDHNIKRSLAILFLGFGIGIYTTQEKEKLDPKPWDDPDFISNELGAKTNENQTP